MGRFTIVGRIRAGRVLACAWLALAMGAGLPALSFAELRELDRIVAIVDDDVVLASELLQRIDSVRQQFEVRDQPMPPNDVLINQLMERLVLESIQLQMGERAGMHVSEEDLTRSIVEIAKQNNLSMDQFRAVLAQDGMTYQDFREQIRRELIVSRVQRARVQSRVVVGDREVDALLGSELGKGLTADDYRVGHILLAVEENAGAAWDAAEERANTLFQELQDGADFCSVSAANSASARALECGDLGWKKAPGLPSLFAERVPAMKPGQVLPPIKSGSGFHLIKLLEKRGATEDVAETRARHILIRPSAIVDAAEAERRLRGLYKQLKNGVDFCALAEEHSDDPGSALVCGDLGWSRPDRYVPEFMRVLEASDVGVLSEPFSTQHGWHVLEVLERRNRDLSTENRRDLARRYLMTQRYDEELQSWLAQIRADAYVDIKL